MRDEQTLLPGCFVRGDLKRYLADLHRISVVDGGGTGLVGRMVTFGRRIFSGMKYINNSY
jgi:hypothetical protein